MNMFEHETKRRLREEQDIAPDLSAIPGPTLIPVPKSWFTPSNAKDRPDKASNFDPFTVIDWVDNVLYKNEVVSGLMPWAHRGLHEDRFLLKSDKDGAFGYVQLDREHYIYRPGLVEKYVFPKRYRPRIEPMSLEQLSEQFREDVRYMPNWWESDICYVATISRDGQRQWYCHSPYEMAKTELRPENPYTAALLLLHGFANPVTRLKTAVRRGELTVGDLPNFLTIDSRGELRLNSSWTGRSTLITSAKSIVTRGNALTTLFRNKGDFPDYDADEYLAIRSELLHLESKINTPPDQLDVGHFRTLFSLIDRWLSLFNIGFSIESSVRVDEETRRSDQPE